MLLIFLYLCAGSAQQAFTGHPASTYAQSVGQDVVFSCVVSGKQGTLLWEKDGMTISNDRQIRDIGPDQARFSIEGDDTSGIFGLKIKNLKESDSGKYQCKVLETGSNKEITSNAAVLTVTSVSRDREKMG